MKLAVIGGSGLYALGLGSSAVARHVKTPFCTESVEVSEEQVGATSVLFLPRHDANHGIPPHLINYRANLWALHSLNATHVIAINAVGGISPGMTTGCLVIPAQLIDYTWGREHTFVGAGRDILSEHIDFTVPYDLALSLALLRAAKIINAEVRTGSVYGCTQGPRLETAAEIRRMRNDGCDIVGMTGMPEASLARELKLHYACLALVVNRAAGLDDGPISVDSMKAELSEGISRVRQILTETIAGIASFTQSPTL